MSVTATTSCYCGGGCGARCQFPPVWGGCAVCGNGCGIGNYLVWNRAGTIGEFACTLHLRAIMKRNKKGKVEVL